MSTAVATAPSRLRPRPLLLSIGLLALVAIFGLVVGPAAVSPTAAIREVANQLPFVAVESGLTDIEAAIVWELRLPRVVLAGMVGAVLAIAGGSYQGVFRNPLADPYLLGVAAGAGLGATAAIVFGRSLPTGSVPPLAFLGAAVAGAATYALARLGGRHRMGATLILAGVAVAAFFTALQTFLQQQHQETIRQVFSWILGRLSTAGWSEVRMLAPYALVSSVLLLAHRRHLDVLSVGEAEAASLGIDTGRVRLTVVAAATLGTAAAVAVSGLIGFVGIIVPHVIRMMGGVSYRMLLPLSLVGGAAFLIAADLVARNVVTGAEVPIGVVTALVGAPFFGLVLFMSARSQ